MGRNARIDNRGRLVIPKELRDRYGFTPGSEVELVSLSDGLSLVPVRQEHRIIQRGKVVAIDTGAGTADLDAFDVSTIRRERLERSSGMSQ